MNIEKIARKALTLLKLKYGLPEIGFIAGGSIGNLMWQIVSGNNAHINDIDVFLFEKPKEDDSKVFEYRKTEIDHLSGYGHVEQSQSYIIKNSYNRGIFNEVIYSSMNKSPQIILDSFDINCTKIGYSIEEDIFYWCDDFIDFLKTGELKISNINTPAHTALRLIKKKYELNAKLNDCELGICQFAITNGQMFVDISKTRFKQRFADIYTKYYDHLKNFFLIKRDFKLEKYLKDNHIHDYIYYLDPPLVNNYIMINPNDQEFSRKLTSKEFLFYVRNICGNKFLQNIWNKLYYFYTSNDYIDCGVIDDKIWFIYEFIKLYPDVIKNLKGLKLSEQFRIIQSVITNITKHYDSETAIAVLENIKLPKDISLDDDECLLLGLSVRKKVKESNLPFLDEKLLF